MNKALNVKTIKVFAVFILLSFTSLFANKSLATNKPIDFSNLIQNQDELLSVDEAFVPSLEILDDEIIIKFEIADNYYLYQERFNLTSNDAQLGKAIFSAGIQKDDPYFGLTEVYKHFVEFSIPFSKVTANPIVLSLGFQGCAEDRLCYPPTTREIKLAYSGTLTRKEAVTNQTPASNNLSSNSTEKFVSEQESLLEDLEERGILWNFFKFVLIGLGLTFTPCVFPMIPIISGIIAGQGKDITARKAFGLSLTYTQAVAIVYALLGVLIALAGKSLSGYLQHPAFVISAATVFVLLSFSMFGFYELQLPASLQAKLAERSNNQKSGSYIGTAIMGVISALIVSPCVTVPLIAILIFISQSGDVLLGATALYGLGVGMGIPLILIAVTEGKFLPKAGGWMDGIKAAFGVAMLAVALYLVKHLLPNSIYMYGWALLLIVPGFYLLKNKLANTGWGNLFKALGLSMLIYGALLMIAGAMGKRDLLQPLSGFSSANLSSTKKIVSHKGLEFERVKTLAQLQAKVALAKSQNKTVMLDFFAKWCAACYEFEELVFTDAKVQQALSNTILLQADVTDNDKQDVALMEAFNVLGLPSIMFFDLQGNELPSFRATGFEKAEVFTRRINAAFKQ